MFIISLFSVVISYHKFVLLLYLILACSDRFMKCYLAQRHLASWNAFRDSSFRAWLCCQDWKGRIQMLTFCLCHALKTTQGDTFIQQSWNFELFKSNVLYLRQIKVAFHVILNYFLTPHRLDSYNLFRPFPEVLIKY